MTSTRKPPTIPDITAITALVPMFHVGDVERSAAFYRLLGFAIGNHMPRTGRIEWAWLYSVNADDWKRGPNLMLTQSSHAIDAKAQEVSYYLYAQDLRSVRDVLLAHGIAAGEIHHPDYLPDGEFRVTDPDGYVLMIAQAAADTP